MGCAQGYQVNPDKEKMDVFFATGITGAGKRTVSKIIADQNNFSFISIQELLEENNNSENQEIQECLQTGSLLNSKILVNVLIKKMLSIQNKVFIISGFPKTLQDLTLFKQKTKQFVNVKKIFIFEINDTIAQSRISTINTQIQQKQEIYQNQTRPFLKSLDENQVCHINSEREIELVQHQLQINIDYILHQKKMIVPDIIFLSGFNNSGKKTQALQIQEKYGFEIVNIVEILEKYSEENPQIGEVIRSKMQQIELIPSDIVVRILQNYIKLGNKYIIEGFPKTMENLNQWNQKMMGVGNTILFIFLQVSAQTAIQRSANKELTEKKNLTYDFQEILNYYKQSNKLAMIDANKKKEIVFRQISQEIDYRINGTQMTLPKVVFFSGPTGSGKSTQVKMLVDKFKFLQIDIKNIKFQDYQDLIYQLIDIIEYQQNAILIQNFPFDLEFFDLWFKKMKKICITKCFLQFECELTRLKQRNQQNNIDFPYEEYEKTMQKVIRYFLNKSLLRTINADKEMDSVFYSVLQQINHLIFDIPIDLPKIIFILGGPGSGKRSICRQVEENQNEFVHINIKKIEAEYNNEISDDELIFIINQIIEQQSSIKTYLISGFPKRSNQMYKWQKIMDGNSELKYFILMECTLQTLQQRLLELGKNSNRSQDVPKDIIQRTIYEEKNILQILDEFHEIELKKVDAEQDLNEVYQSFIKIIT